MRYRLQLTVVVLATVCTVGCASNQFKPMKWWRSRAGSTGVAQATEPVTAQSNIESLSASPPKLPPGIELPPTAHAEAQTQTTGANQPPELSSSAVIFASGN